MTRMLAPILVAASLAAACAGGDAHHDADAGTVEVFGPFRGDEAELFAASLEPFEASTGIDVRYTGTGSFVADLEARVRSVTPPDIAMVPQPGLVAELARAGSVLPLSDGVVTAVNENYDDDFRELGDVDGVLVGVPFRASVKSLVWYRPELFETRGLEIPRTLDELEELVVEIEQSGTTPWCLGLEAEASTGWVATDWTEELVLRLAGQAVYEGWAAGAVAFADEPVAEAFRTFRSLVLAPGRAAGGVAGVVRTQVQASPGGLFSDPPACLLHRQGSFAYGWMPDDLEFGPDGDIDFFPLPASERTDPPILVGSTLAVAFTDRPEVQELMAHLTTAESMRLWAEAGGFIGPQRATASLDLQPVDRAAIDLVLNASIVEADASDAMPPEIGSDLLWREITDWVADATSYEQFAATVDEALAAAP